MSRQLAVFGLVAVMAAGLASACSARARKEKKCREVKEHIVGLAADVEVRLGKLAPEKERLTGEEHHKAVEERVDPHGGFVALCMESIPDEALECMLAARRLSDLESCRRSAGP